MKMPIDEKCRYYDFCPLAKNEYTCNHEDEASGYCGKYRELSH
jgi:hypothetical protein